MKPREKIHSHWIQEYSRGYGYLKSLKKVRISGFSPSLSIELYAIQGMGNHVRFERHDLIITTEQALRTISDHRGLVESRPMEVFMGFEMINPRATTFFHKNQEKNGQIDAKIEGYLSKIVSLSLDGHVIYRSDNHNSSKNL